MNNSSSVSNALVYRRVSTDHQDNSLKVQEQLNDEYCARLNISVVAAYEDPDVSGSIPFSERLGGSALLNRMAIGDIAHLVTSKQDRLGRDTLDTIGIIRRVWELGVIPHFTSEGGAFPRTSQNELLFEIKASVAQYERNLIKERTTAVLRHKASRGELTGTVPFGFDARYTFADGYTLNLAAALSPSDVGALNAVHGPLLSKQLIPNLVEQEWVRQIAAWRGAPLSLKAIADRLNAAGVPSKRGGRWQCGQVDSLLRSRSAAQLLRPTELAA